MQIKLPFLGAAQNVPGSRYLLVANGAKFLTDCGLYQEREFRSRNWDPFPVPPESLDAVLLTHAHLDCLRICQKKNSMAFWLARFKIFVIS